MSSQLFWFGVFVIVSLLIVNTYAETYFLEEFNSGWESRWVKSTLKGKDQGSVGLSAGKWHGDASDKGLQTQEDYRFYGISAKLPRAFSNNDKDLIIQYTVKHEQNIDCGGAYIKLLPEGLNQDQFGGDSAYNIMFGPDICGTTTRRTHAIFNYKGNNLLVKKDVKCETDQLTHLYTFHVKPDNTYEILIDNKLVESGSLESDWAFLEANEIRDPDAKKPADWVDSSEIPDPSDVKPENYDDVKAKIPDPKAKKPEDWDDEADGEWEAPQVDNPAYKGPWKPKSMKNPAYKGPWTAPMIPNPKYVSDPHLYAYDSIAYVGFELWQVKSGTIFDNIIVTDSLEEAKQLASRTWSAQKDAEKKMFDEVEEQKRKEEEQQRKLAEEKHKAEEEAKKKAAPASSDDDAKLDKLKKKADEEENKDEL